MDWELLLIWLAPVFVANAAVWAATGVLNLVLFAATVVAGSLLMGLSHRWQVWAPLVIGPLLGVLSWFLQSANWNWSALAALVPGILLLLAAFRWHWALPAAYGTLVLFVTLDWLPVWALFALLTLGALHFPKCVAPEDPGGALHFLKCVAPGLAQLYLLVQMFVTLSYLLKGIIR